MNPYTYKPKSQRTRVAVRRIVAYVFDMLLICLLCGGIAYAIRWGVAAFILFVLICPPFFFFRDCIFRNASPGKFILGLRVVDPEGRIPDWKTLVRRNWLMIRYGYRIYGIPGSYGRSGFTLPFLKENIDIAYVEGNTDYFLYWETKVTKTMVVYRKNGNRAIR